MPFESQAQEGYLHEHPEILGKEKLAEFDAATKGKHLPVHVPKYHTGVDVVPRTGLAHLQKGEAVIPKKDNPMVNPYAGITKGDKKPKKEIREISTTKSHDGKMIHVHKHHHPEHHPDETHVSNDMGDLHSHMEDHMGTPSPDAATGANAPAPMTAAPSPMPEAAPAAGAGPAVGM
jgi:hypothetical protein